MHTSSLQPPPLPPSQPIMVVLSCADECEITSAPLLCSVSDCLSDTCSDSAPLCLPTHSLVWVLVPSPFLLYSFTPLLLYTRPTSQRRMAGHHAARQTQHQDTPPQHSSLNNNTQQAILSAICPYTFTELKIPKLVS